MLELQKFNYAKVYCDGCGKCVDSQYGTDILHDLDELIECCLPDILGWEQQDKSDRAKWLCPECAKDASHRKHKGEGRIEVRPLLLYGVHCDVCGELAGSYVGESFWQDEFQALEEAIGEGFTELNGKHCCPDCWDECEKLDSSEDCCETCKNSKWCEGDLPNEKPNPSSRCESIVKDSQGEWHKCPWLKWEKGVKCECSLPEGEKCPRVVDWEHEKDDIAHSNEKISREVAEWTRCVEDNHVF